MIDTRVLVQRIEVAWTKASRGAPEATERNSIPDAFVLPEDLVGQSAVSLYHDLLCDERGDFRPVVASSAGASLKPRSPGASMASALVLWPQDGSLVVDFSSSARSMPRRRSQSAVLRLEPGQWGRVAYNARFGGRRDWSYGKYVYNVLHRSSEPIALDLFTSTEPSVEFRRFDRLR